MVALLGPNGAGKTTTLRSICGMVRASGRIAFRGKDLTGWRPRGDPARDRARARGPRHVPRPDRDENLKLGAYGRRDPDVRGDIDRWFGIFPRLADRRDQPAGSLSGGEQQMLAVAGRCCPGRGCCCWTSRRWGWRRSWSARCSRCSTGSGSSRAPGCCWSSRTRRSPWSSPMPRTCWWPAGRCCPARLRRSAPRTRSGAATSVVGGRAWSGSCRWCRRHRRRLDLRGARPGAGLIFRSTGVVNFAQGEMAMFSDVRRLGAGRRRRPARAGRGRRAGVRLRRRHGRRAGADPPGRGR